MATLLVAVVGATFAYFTATSTNDDNSAGTAAATTAKVAQVKLSASAIEGSKDAIWPGTSNYIGTSVSASVEEEGSNSEATYEVNYTLTGSVTPSAAFSQGKIDWKLYKVTEEVKTPVTCTPVSDGGENKFSQTCTLDTKLTGDTAVEAASGSIEVGSSDAETVTYTGTIKTGAATEYFYLVYTYESKPETDQSADAGGTKTVTAAITNVTSNSVKVAS